jgi:hypothetical protein
LVVVGLTQYALYRRLRSRHPEAWREIGMPVFSEYRRYVSAMGSFVWKGNYRPLQDSMTTMMSLAIKVLTIAFAVAFLAAVGYILAGH